MKSKNLLKMAAMAVVLSAGFASCSSDDDADNSVVAGSQAALDQACADWKVARVLPMSTLSILIPTHGL